MAASRRVYVVGVGMTKFQRVSGNTEWNYPEMAKEAGTAALKDARIPYDQVEQACVGYVYGDTTSGQRAVYELGLTGIPVYNVNNACSSGSTALMMARQFIEGGLSDCVLALGFEKMERQLSMETSFRTHPMDKHMSMFAENCEVTSAQLTPQLFGQAGMEHMRKYGTKPEHFAKIAYKNHKHSVHNPYAQMQKEYTLEEVLNSKQIFGPLTKLQCCPTSDGAGAAILANESFVKRHGLESQAVEIVAQAMATDQSSTFQEKSMMKLVGFDMTKKAAKEVYEKAGISPHDVDVVELHDCFSANELITYEALGLCGEGQAGEFIDRGDNTYGGQVVVNPSGGLISKGHPLGATGLAQCAELCWQMRRAAGKRQVPNAKLALAHNLGLGGAAVVTLYKHGFPDVLHRDTMPVPGVSVTSASDFKSAVVFDEIKHELSRNGANYVKKIKGVFRFEIKNTDNKSTVYIVDVKNENGSVSQDDSVKGDVTIVMKDEDLLNVMLGKTNAQQAFFQGKLKIKGNMALAMKLKELQIKPKL